MSLTIIIVLLALALVLCLVETFLIPGFGICGIISGACTLMGVGGCFMLYGVWWGLGVSLLVLIFGGLLLRWVMHSERIKRLSLQATIDSTVANEEINNISVGDEGVALTRLALVGNAQIGSVECEVRSAQGFVEEGTPVVVTKIHMGEIYVKPV